MTKNGEALTAYVTLAKYMQGRCGVSPCDSCLFYSKRHDACLTQRLFPWPGQALSDETMEEINTNFAKLEREDHHG